jgi:hypothetical protein
MRKFNHISDEINLHWSVYKNHENVIKLLEYYHFYLKAMDTYNFSNGEDNCARQQALRYKKSFFKYYK